MKSSHLLANAKLDKAFEAATGLYKDFSNPVRIKRALKEAKRAGHTAIQIMVDNKNIGNADEFNHSEIELVSLYFKAGVDVAPAEIIATVDIWKSKVGNAFFEIELT